MDVGAPPQATRGYRTGPRLLAAGGALVAAAAFLVLQPLALAQAGYPLAAGTLVVAATPFVAFLGMLALAPAALQRILAPWTALDLRDAGHVGAAVIMAATLFFVLGYGSLVSGVLAIETVVLRGEGSETLTDIDGNALFVGLAQNLIVLTLPPLLYVAFVHGGGPAIALARLGLRADGAGRATVAGLVAAVAAFLFLALVNVVWMQLPVPPPENERALAIAKSVTVLGAFGLAIGAAVSEEVFFRGFLQPRIGLWAQAIVFGLAHLSYVSVSQIVVVTLLGVVFGLLYQRTRNLMAPIAAHFLFNLVNLLAGIYAPT